jgi:FkbM family methyltransferase
MSRFTTENIGLLLLPILPWRYDNLMTKLSSNERCLFRNIENIIFGTINHLLSKFIEKTRFSKRLFDFYARILPVPHAIVRGVPIKVMIPLNQVGVYNTFKSWEEREPEVLDWIDGFEPGCTFFDVGASFGTETLYAALKKDGPRKIVSFDLSLESFFNLIYNLSLNNINNVDHYFLALSDDIKFISFLEPTQYFSIKGRDKYDFIPFKALSISLDQFCKMTLLSPDYIKIDVDGAEQSIISGMSETVQNKKLKSVAIEVNHQSEPAIAEFFAQAGFKVAFERRFGAGEDLFKNLIFTRK